MNTKAPVLSQKTKNAIASLAIENMFPSDDFINKLAAIDKGELTYDDVRKELDKKYGGR